MVKIIKTPTLRTQRLILTSASVEHAPALQKQFNNWNIIKHLNDSVPWPYPDDGVLNFLKNDALPRVAAGKAHLWAITLDDKPIGIIEYRFEQITSKNRGFWIGEPYWNKGYITEAVIAVNDFIFFEVGVEKMILDNFSSNIASCRIKEKTGASFLKTITRSHRGGEVKIDIWELTLENWKKFKQKNLL